MTSHLQLLSLAGKRALITGAGTGLGQQMALGLAEAGADLIICGRRQAPLGRDRDPGARVWPFSHGDVHRRDRGSRPDAPGR